MKVRQLKIYGAFQRRTDTPHAFRPNIQLAGKWLEEAGFEIGKQVFVTVENGKLTIVKG
jgi:toxic protein SymE